MTENVNLKEFEPGRAAHSCKEFKLTTKEFEIITGWRKPKPSLC